MGNNLGRALRREPWALDNGDEVTLVDGRAGYDHQGYPTGTSTRAGSVELAKKRNDHLANKISTGRGGAGNFIYAPLRDIESENREHVKSAEVASTALSTGRGGIGNIRRLSHDTQDTRLHIGPHSHVLLNDDAHVPPLAAGSVTWKKDGLDRELEYEREVMARHREARARKGLRSTGRGGMGNILRHPIP